MQVASNSGSIDPLALIIDNPAFSDLSETEQQELANCGKLHSYQPSDVVFSIECTGKTFYLVSSGRFKLELKNGKVINFSRGQLFGEISVLTDQKRSGTVTAIDNGFLYSFHFDDLTANLQPMTAIHVLKALTRRLSSYLEKHTSTELIQAGESETVELKEYWGNETKLSIIQTLVAMMNGEGGVVFLGVNDDREPVGVKSENYKDMDTLKLDIMNLVKQKIGGYYSTLLSLVEESIGGKRILRMECRPSNQPAFFKDSRKGQLVEMFFIRTGPQTTHLRQSDSIRKIIERFPALAS